jgi:hypothetical protein
MGLITLEMLQSLASPNVAAHNEVQAYLATLNASQRVAGLVQVLQQEQETCTTAPLLQLAAILLRREIIALDDCLALQALVDPLWQILHNRSLATSSTLHGSLNVMVNVAIVNCLAEICASLDRLHDAAAAAVVSHILSTTHSLSDMTLLLWTAMAERAPHAFAQSNVWQHLPLLSLDTSTSNSTTVAAALKLLVAAATAVLANITTSKSSTGTDALNDSNMHHDPVRAMGRHYFTPLLNRILREEQQQDQDEEIWTLLVQLAEDVPDLLGLVHGASASSDNNDVGRVLDWCAATLSKPTTTTCRLSAIQVILSLWSHFRVTQNHSSPYQQVLSLSVQSCWNIMSQQNDENDNWEDSDEWAAEPATMYDHDAAAAGSILSDDNGATDHAEALLGDLLRLAPCTALSVLLPLVQEALQSVSTPSSHEQELHLERRRCAAWLALSCSLEVVPLAMAPHVASLTHAALAAAADSTGRQRRVVYCAVRLLGLVCEGTNTTAVVMGQHAQDDNAATATTALWTAMLQQLTQSSQHACTKIAALACQALVSYCRPCLETLRGNDDGPRQHPARTVLLTHLSSVLQALVTGPLSLDKLGSHHSLGTIVVQIRATGAVACIAQVAGSAFAPYYSSVMPNLLAKAAMNINHSQHQESHHKCGPSYELQQLAGSSLEAATMIGQAVSLRNENDGQVETVDASHLFTASDAHQIMQWAVAALEQANESWWPLDLLLAACARVASVLEAEYAPYVDRVLPHLLARATDPSDVEFAVRE